MISLDTNVISELMKAEPNPKVEAWLGSKPAVDIFTTAITEAELRYGVQILPRGRRRNEIAAATDLLLIEDFSERILPFDGPAAIAYAMVATERREAGKPISQFDAQIAAIARSRGAAVATRNITDFEGCGIDVIDPWNMDASP